MPLIIRWPGQTPRGVVCPQPVSSCDLFLTLLKMLGVVHEPVPAVDGADVSPQLRHPHITSLPRPLFFHYPHYYATTSPVSAIRVGDWKLLEYFEDQRVELYDLASDLGETTDLSAKFPDRVAALRTQLQQWRVDVQAQLPLPNLGWDRPAGSRARAGYVTTNNTNQSE